MSDGILFAGILLFFFVLWFISGGPTRPISFSGPYITPITDVGDVQSGYDADQWFDVPDTSGWFSGANLAGDTAIADPSVFRGQVRIVSVSPGYDGDEEGEYVTIELASDAAAPITISGWRLRSDATYKSGTIPNGAVLPARGVNRTAPIVLEPGDRAIVATADSPIGVSFRENRCTGYFGTRQGFNPSLYSDCPAPLDEFERYYVGNQLADDSCYDYVRSIPQCTNPTHRDRPRLTARCEAFIDEYLEYDGCVAAHALEPGFRGDEWRVYLDRSSSLWKGSREAVRLLDASGKTVDLYTY